MHGISTQRSIEPHQLQKILRGDLDWVVMRALEKDRTRRYATANDLADDLERYLAGEPVEARPPTTAYKLHKFVRKHRALVATTVFTFVCLLAALATSSWFWRLTAHERDQKESARQRVRSILDQVASEAIDTLLAQQPRLDERHRAFMRRTLEGYQQFAQDPGVDPATRADVANAHLRMARIRGRLGEISEQDKALGTAVAMYEQLLGDEPENAEFLRKLAECHNEFGIRYSQSRNEALAQRSFDRAAELLRELWSRNPLDAKIRNDLAMVLNGLGNLLGDMRKNEEALAAFRQSLDLLAGLAAEHPEEPTYRSLLASTRYNLGILLDIMEQPESAQQEYRDAIALYEQLLREQPFDPKIRFELSSSLINLGNSLARSQRRLADAIELCDRGRRLQEPLVSQFPAVPFYRLRLGRTYRSLAQLHEQLKQDDLAEEMHRRSLEVREGLVNDFGNQPEYRRDLGSGRYQLGQFLYQRRQPDKAETEFQLALEIQHSLVAEKPAVAEYAIELTRTLGMLGYCALNEERLEQAAEYFQRAQALQESLDSRFPSELQLRSELGLTYSLLAAVRLKQESPQEALQLADQAVEHLQTLQLAHPDYPPIRSHLLDAHYQRASALVAVHRPKQAVDALRETIAAGSRDANRLREDPHFESLRGRADFQELLSELSDSLAE